MRERGSPRRGGVVLGVTCLLVIFLACASVVLSVRWGAFAPPWFDQHFGMLRVVGYSTWNADCPPYTGCAPTRSEAYVIWLIWDSAQPPDLYRLLKLPTAHGL